MIIVNCQQGTPEWHEARTGAVTASMFKEVRRRLKSGPNKGDFTKEARDYAFRLAIERIAGHQLDEDKFETWEMRRGRELEPEARAKHERVIGKFIEETGIVLTDDRHFGASADGLIEPEGGSEYKCLVSPSRIRQIVLDEDLSEFTDQIQGCMWLTGRKWWHFVLYCPALAPVGKDLIIHEVERDDNYIEALEADLLSFNQVVEGYREQLAAGQKGVF